MSTACSVADCQFRSKVTFHSPQSRAHLELWKKILKKTVDTFYVCDQHFEEKFFRVEKRLTIDAFPTQYIGSVDAGNRDFCQCCMKSFVRTKFISQVEIKMVIEERFRKDFHNAIGYEIPAGVVCQKCFESVKSFIKFRNEIRDKQKTRDEVLQLRQQQQHDFQLDPSIRVKEEPIDDDYETENNNGMSDVIKIKEEPLDMDSDCVVKEEKVNAGNNESFLISEIKTEPEQLQEIITKPTNVFTNQKIIIKRPGGSIIRPASLQKFHIVQPQKVVKIIRGSTTVQKVVRPIRIGELPETTETPIGYKCQYCPNRFIERRFVVEHIKQKHTFPCTQCNSVFPFKITLIKHQMSLHGNSNGAKTPNYRYSCRICGLKFLSNYTLDAHMLQKHPQTLIEDRKNASNNIDDNIIIIRPLSMPSKSQAASTTTTVVKRVPLPRPPIQIQPSPKAIQYPFKIKSEFGEPVRVMLQPVVKKPVTTLVRRILTPIAPPVPPEPIVEDPDGIPCLDCGLLLKPDKLLKHRMDAHDLNTHNLFYFCDMCGIEIKGKTQLINHMTMQHLSSNYIRCEFCDGLFESKTDVICHKNLQHNFNGTRYTCHFCYKIFGGKREMILHRKAHYSEKDSRDKLARVFCKKFKSYEPKGAEYK